MCSRQAGYGCEEAVMDEVIDLPRSEGRLGYSMGWNPEKGLVVILNLAVPGMNPIIWEWPIAQLDQFYAEVQIQKARFSK